MNRWVVAALVILIFVGVPAWFFAVGFHLLTRTDKASPGHTHPPWAKVAPEQIAEAKKHGVPVAFENDLGMRFVLIPAGTFLMGSPEDEEGRGDDETQHEVTITKPYYMQITEVTNGQYRLYKTDHDTDECDGRSMNGDRQPVAMIAWKDALDFGAWVSRQEELICSFVAGIQAQEDCEIGTSRTYQLPSEAQWEYACRAGTTTPFWFGETVTIDEANVENSVLATTRVGTYPPNGWGLHDMHGNLLEWCQNLYEAGPPSLSGRAMEDPVAPAPGRATSSGRVLRGGSWHHRAHRTRSACRGRWDDGRNVIFGFRLVSPLPESSK